MGDKTSPQETTKRDLVAVFGAGGGLGRALVKALLASDTNLVVLAVSRQAQSFEHERLRWHKLTLRGDSEAVQSQHDETAATFEAYQSWLTALAEEGVELRGVISTIGWLHRKNSDTEDWQPERRIEQLSLAQLQAYFAVNASLPILLLQALKPLLPKNKPAYVVQLGAKVGSISDNHLGGWYGYRASKAALNMLFRTAAIEFKRTHKQLTLAVIHPGTTNTELSEPFQQRLPADKLYSPELSAQRIVTVIAALTPENSGSFYFWDGEKLPY